MLLRPEFIESVFQLKKDIEALKNQLKATPVDEVRRDEILGELIALRKIYEKDYGLFCGVQWH